MGDDVSRTEQSRMRIESNEEDTRRAIDGTEIPVETEAEKGVPKGQGPEDSSN